VRKKRKILARLPQDRKSFYTFDFQGLIPKSPLLSAGWHLGKTRDLRNSDAKVRNVFGKRKKMNVFCGKLY